MNVYNDIGNLIKAIGNLKPGNQARAVKYTIILAFAIFVIPNIWNVEFPPLTQHRIIDSFVIIIPVIFLILLCAYITKYLYNEK